MKTKSTYGWHFTSDKLRDGRPVPPINEWLVHKGEVIPCKAGLHASPTPFDALQYAPASVLHFVELRGVLLEHGSPVDKLVASERRIIASVDVEPVLRAFARQQALSVAHLWDAPEVATQYLRTGDEALRAAALSAALAATRAATRDAAWDAARDAAWDAALAAAWDAGLDAARAAARVAAWDAARDAARAAARVAAWDAARDAARVSFNELIRAAFANTDAAKYL